MIGAFRIEGHAIVSRDDRIADAGGAMPPGLRNDADWHNFQSALDEAAIVVLGRRSHVTAPNPAQLVCHGPDNDAAHCTEATVLV